MNENEVMILQKLADSLGVATTEVVGHYVEWYIYDSIIWLLIGLIALAFSIKLKSKMIDLGDSVEIHSIWPKTALFIFGAVCVGVNAVDLLAPHGIAIHQLLKDISGK